MYRYGFNVGSFVKRKRWFNLGYYGHQFINNAVSTHVAFPLIAECFSREPIIKYKGMIWFNEKFLHWLLLWPSFCLVYPLGALATVVGALIEVSLMLLVAIRKKPTYLFDGKQLQ